MLTYEPKSAKTAPSFWVSLRQKMKGSCLIKSSIVLGLRIIGKGFSAGKKKLCAFPRFTFPVKTCSAIKKKTVEKQLNAAQKNINAAHWVKSKAQIVSLNVEYPLMVFGNAEATHL
ncbi:hypothetical protein TNCV_320481 [Trichonephila clavipes]|nr:hypothetical protein TNCV_320481 [Trichonephila clavipes]